MEYPMATLLSGPGRHAFHEWMHSWYQSMLGTNEYFMPGWMKGLRSMLQQKWKLSTMRSLRCKRLEANPRRFNTWIRRALLPCGTMISTRAILLAKSGWEEPLTTHADHFNTNFAYSIACLFKGRSFLEQLGYIIGEKIRDKFYWNITDVGFKHPNANDFLQVAEKVSG